MQEETKMNESYAPMLEHLDELRTRIVRCALALLLGMVVCFALFQQQLTEIVMGPFMALEQDMIYTQFAEGFHKTAVAQAQALSLSCSAEPAAFDL